MAENSHVFFNEQYLSLMDEKYDLILFGVIFPYSRALKSGKKTGFCVIFLLKGEVYLGFKLRYAST